MDVLMFPFVSLVDKTTHIPQLEKDGNVKVMNNVAKIIKKEFNAEIKTIYPRVCNPLIERYDFQFSQIGRAIRKTNPDIIISDLDGVSRNVKVLLKLKKIKSKLVTKINFPDFPDEKKASPDTSFWLRQVDGALASDLTAFLSSPPEKKFLWYLENFWANDLIYKSDVKTTVWSVLVDPKKIKTGEKFEKKTILFLGRITFTPGEYTNWRLFVKSIKELKKIRDDFQVIMTNPSKQVSAKELGAMVPNLNPRFECLENEEYYKLLRRCHVVCSLQEKEGTGGVGFREAVLSGCLPVVLRSSYCYNTLFGEKYKFYARRDERSIAKVISEALDCRDKVQEFAKKCVEREFESGEKNIVKEYFQY